MVLRIEAKLAVAALVWFVLPGCGGSPAPVAKPGVEAAVRPESLPLVIETVPATQPAEEPVHSRPPEALPDIVHRAFPRAASVARSSEPFPHRVAYDSAGRVLGYEVFSDSAGTTARGYAGRVPVQVLLDERGRPMRVYILENCETPAYMELIRNSGLLEKLLGFDPAEPESLDAVSLATSSSRAIIAGVTGLAELVSGGLAEPGRRAR